MSPPSQARTVLSAGIIDRHAVNDSGCPNLPKLVASNSDIAGQSASVADRISMAVDVSEASTELDGATQRCRSASEFRAQPIPLNGTEGALVMATDLTLYLDDQPGELARVGDVLGKAGTNIAGLCGLTTGGARAGLRSQPARGRPTCHSWCRTRRRRSRRCRTPESRSRPSRK